MIPYYYPLIVWIIIALLMAYRDARLIKNHIYPSHPANGAIHIACAVYLLLNYNWKIALASLLIVHIVFDIALNLMRGLAWNYTNPHPDVSKQAFTDRVEKVFGFAGSKAVELVVAVLLLI